MRELWVALQIYLYSVSVYLLLSKSRVIVATASLILPASSNKVVGNGGMYTASLMYPQKKQKKKMKGSNVRQTR
jgi:hypothetical protein